MRTLRTENHLRDTASGRASSRKKTGPAQAGSFLLSCSRNPVIVTAISQPSDSDLSSPRARGMPRIKPFSGATGHTRYSPLPLSVPCARFAAACLPARRRRRRQRWSIDRISPKSRKERTGVRKKGGMAGRVCLENVIGIVTRTPKLSSSTSSRSSPPPHRFLMSRTCGAFEIFVSLSSKKNCSRRAGYICIHFLTTLARHLWGSDTKKNACFELIFANLYNLAPYA